MRERVSPGVAIGVAAVAGFLVVALLFGFTVVSTEEEAALTVEFDPVTFVEENWDAVQTAINDNAVPLADVLNRIELIKRDAPAEMLRALYGMGDKEYTRLRRHLGVPTGVGRPPRRVLRRRAPAGGGRRGRAAARRAPRPRSRAVARGCARRG